MQYSPGAIYHEYLYYRNILLRNLTFPYRDTWTRWAIFKTPSPISNFPQRPVRHNTMMYDSAVHGEDESGSRGPWIVSAPKWQRKVTDLRKRSSRNTGRCGKRVLLLMHRPQYARTIRHHKAQWRIAIRASFQIRLFIARYARPLVHVRGDMNSHLADALPILSCLWNNDVRCSNAIRAKI